MIRDLDQAKLGDFGDGPYDVCICGAGPAGITLALELAPRHRVLLLEAGGLVYTNESQRVYQGDNVGHEYFPLDATRLRFLGGSTNHWGGYCRPLDKQDFEVRDAVAYSGWPIGRHDLTPYVFRAAQWVELPAINWSPDSLADWEKPLVSADDLRRIVFHWSPPTNFGDRYRDALEKTDGIDCWLNANLTSVSLAEDGRSVDRIEFRNYEDSVFHAQPRLLVLATGGIENARLLLNFDRELNGGLGQGRDLIGRFFGDHPHYIGADFVLEDRPRAAVARAIEPDWGQVELEHFRYYAPTARFQRAAGLPNFCIRFQPRYIVSSELNSTFKERLRSALCESEVAREVAESLRKRGLLCSGSIDGTVKVTWEQRPNPDSRVTLASERDRFGLRRTRLDWRLQKSDKDTLRQVIKIFGHKMAKHRIGRLRIRDWLLNEDTGLPGFSNYEVAGNHHIGTTRMAESTEHGVVDGNQRMFGTDNLYIAGSSVFPTMGYANPTFTIIQMTLRLADHLDQVLRHA